MICSACGGIHKGDFSSEIAYMNFEKKLLEASQKGDLAEIGKVQTGGPFLKLRYLCNRCGRCWQLTVPDQAFRGEWKEWYAIK
jgi:hypothetical protein